MGGKGGGLTATAPELVAHALYLRVRLLAGRRMLPMTYGLADRIRRNRSISQARRFQILRNEKMPLSSVFDAAEKGDITTVRMLLEVAGFFIDIRECWDRMRLATRSAQV